MKGKIFLAGGFIFYAAFFTLGGGGALADTKVLSGKHTIVYDIVNPLGVEFLPNYANNSYSQKVLQQTGRQTHRFRPEICRKTQHN